MSNTFPPKTRKSILFWTIAILQSVWNSQKKLLDLSSELHSFPRSNSGAAQIWQLWAKWLIDCACCLFNLQAHSLKGKFYHSLKELHKSYLKSPKHGKFGLPHFWSYLNHNEYYSDAFGNDIFHYNPLVEWAAMLIRRNDMLLRSWCRIRHHISMRSITNVSALATLKFVRATSLQGRHLFPGPRCRLICCSLQNWANFRIICVEIIYRLQILVIKVLEGVSSMCTWYTVMKVSALRQYYNLCGWIDVRFVTFVWARCRSMWISNFMYRMHNIRYE